MPRSVEAVCIDPAHAEDIWPLVERMIARACTHDDLSDVETIKQNALKGRVLVWVAWDGSSVLGAWITELSAANGKLFCTVVACGGEAFERWRHLINDVEKFAREEGCVGVRIIGRAGWLRALNGYRKRAVVIEKVL